MTTVQSTPLSLVLESLQKAYGAEAFRSAVLMVALAPALPQAAAALPQAAAAVPQAPAAMSEAAIALPEVPVALPAPLPPSAKEPKEKGPPSAWNQLVTATVAEMKQSGWESWTDLKGQVWPASRQSMVKDKSGAEREAHVYDGGEHNGKEPSPALGGMVRASYLKAQSEGTVAEKTRKNAEALVKAEPADAETEPDEASAAAKKGGRPKMTPEQKAAAKAKREAKKASAAEPIDLTSGLPEGWAELTESKPKTVKAPKPKAPKPKPLDLSVYETEIEGNRYYTNDRGDIITIEGEWFGRLVGGKIDTSVEEPLDLATIEMRE